MQIGFESARPFFSRRSIAASRSYECVPTSRRTLPSADANTLAVLVGSADSTEDPAPRERAARAGGRASSAGFNGAQAARALMDARSAESGSTNAPAGTVAVPRNCPGTTTCSIELLDPSSCNEDEATAVSSGKDVYAVGTFSKCEQPPISKHTAPQTPIRFTVMSAFLIRAAASPREGAAACNCLASSAYYAG